MSDPLFQAKHWLSEAVKSTRSLDELFETKAALQAFLEETTKQWEEDLRANEERAKEAYLTPRSSLPQLPNSPIASTYRSNLVRFPDTPSPSTPNASSCNAPASSHETPSPDISNASSPSTPNASSCNAPALSFEIPRNTSSYEPDPLSESTSSDSSPNTPNVPGSSSPEASSPVPSSSPASTSSYTNELDEPIYTCTADGLLTFYLKPGQTPILHDLIKQARRAGNYGMFRLRFPESELRLETWKKFSTPVHLDAELSRFEIETRSHGIQRIGRLETTDEIPATEESIPAKNPWSWFDEKMKRPGGLDNARYYTDIDAEDPEIAKYFGKLPLDLFPTKGDALAKTNKVTGFHTPLLYYGINYSPFALHYDECNTVALNLCLGGEKHWRFIPDNAKLGEVCKQYPHEFRFKCSMFVKHESLWADSEWLKEHGVPFKEVTQYAGDLFVILPGTYHEGFSGVWSVNMAKAFALDLDFKDYHSCPSSHPDRLVNPRHLSVASDKKRKEAPVTSSTLLRPRLPAQLSDKSPHLVDIYYALGSPAAIVQLYDTSKASSISQPILKMDYPTMGRYGVGKTAYYENVCLSLRLKQQHDELGRIHKKSLVIDELTKLCFPDVVSRQWERRRDWVKNRLREIRHLYELDKAFPGLPYLLRSDEKNLSLRYLGTIPDNEWKQLVSAWTTDRKEALKDMSEKIGKQVPSLLSFDGTRDLYFEVDLDNLTDLSAKADPMDTLKFCSIMSLTEASNSHEQENSTRPDGVHPTGPSDPFEQEIRLSDSLDQEIRLSDSLDQENSDVIDLFGSYDILGTSRYEPHANGYDLVNMDLTYDMLDRA